MAALKPSGPFSVKRPLNASEDSVVYGQAFEYCLSGPLSILPLCLIFMKYAYPDPAKGVLHREIKTDLPFIANITLSTHQKILYIGGDHEIQSINLNTGIRSAKWRPSRYYVWALGIRNNLIILAHINHIRIFDMQRQTSIKSDDIGLRDPRSISVNEQGRIFCIANRYSFISECGINGKIINAFGYGKFRSLKSISARNGELYALDECMVKIFGLDGKFRREFGSEGSGPGQFMNPNDIAVSPS